MMLVEPGAVSLVNFALAALREAGPDENEEASKVSELL